jgi:hypothetical protein
MLDVNTVDICRVQPLSLLNIVFRRLSSGLNRHDFYTEIGDRLQPTYERACIGGNPAAISDTGKHSYLHILTQVAT